MPLPSNVADKRRSIRDDAIFWCYSSLPIHLTRACLLPLNVYHSPISDYSRIHRRHQTQLENREASSRPLSTSFENSAMISCEETDVSSGLQVVAELRGEASMEGGFQRKDKRRWRGRRTRCTLVDYRYRRIRASLPAARLPRMPTRKRRNMVPGYYRHSFGAGIRDVERKRKNKTKKAAEADDEDEREEEEQGRPSGVAAKPIPSDSLFIFRRSLPSAHPLLSVRWALHLTPFTSFLRGYLRECNRATRC